MAAKPTVVFVPGAWYIPAHFTDFFDDLQAKGFRVIASALPSSAYGDTVLGKGLEDDIRAVREDLKPLLDAGRRVIMIGHSYGSVPAGAAIDGESVEERAAKGLKGGVVSFVHVCAFAAMAKGKSLFEQSGSKWATEHIHYVTDDQLSLKPGSAKFFFNDLDPEAEKQLGRLLVNLSKKPFLDPLPFVTPELKTPKHYVICKQDQVLAPEVQHMISQGIGAEVTELDCGHTPFAREDMRKALVEVVEKVAA